MVAFVEFPCAASYTASCAKKLVAVFSHAPNVSTSGTHFQPISEQIGVLSLLCLAAAPATTPASDKILDFSGEVMDTSMAAGLSLVSSLE